LMAIGVYQFVIFSLTNQLGVNIIL
jgi:hypothetical protein